MMIRVPSSPISVEHRRGAIGPRIADFYRPQRRGGLKANGFALQRARLRPPRDRVAV